MNDQERNMFGCSAEDIKEAFGANPFGTHPGEVAISMLSDVQELLHMAQASPATAGARLEECRKMINRVKFGIDAYLVPDREAELGQSQSPSEKVEIFVGDETIRFGDKSFEVMDAKERIWEVSEVSINKKGHIPDVKVVAKNKYGLSAGDAWICDDDVFVEGIMEHLRKAGYEGSSFGRAESGMQGEHFLMLEPGKGFSSWASSIGWNNLSARKRLNP